MLPSSACSDRPLERDDGPLVQAVFDAIGTEMRYRRFLGLQEAAVGQDLETLTAVDHHGHEARVAVHAETGEPLGIGRTIQEPGRPDTAEASVAVVDAWQGRGLGGLLIDLLVRRAHEGGICRFTAVLLTPQPGDSRGRGRRSARVEIPPPNALPWQPEWACAMIRA